MDTTLISRVDELEIRNAYLERSLEELNKHIYQQQQQIDRMEAAMKQVTKRILELAPGSTNVPDNERPPHY